MRIEDYALIGDTETAALVGFDGSIDWLCLPRFDAGACFAALLGDESNGRWRLAPKGEVTHRSRRYRGDTLILETELRTADGAVRLIDTMPVRDEVVNVIRIVEGIDGRVPMRMDLTVRFDYGSVVPWVRRIDGRLNAIAGPDAVVIGAPVPLRGEGMSTVAEFEVEKGQRLEFALTWYPSNQPAPEPLDAERALEDTEAFWTEWSSRCTYQGPYEAMVRRSLLTLKALTYAPTGGIVAAPTTSLPEALGGVRNWDYRYCWLRDATFTLYSLLLAGYSDEAQAWRDWLLRAIAGDPSKLQIMYGCAGERRLDEWEVPWLAGYEGSAPVRVGNGAAGQLQLDVYGEVMDALYQARRVGLPPEAASWDLQRALLDFLEGGWRQPDEGLWEVRGPRQHFTHSKVMAWVAFDRAVKAIEHGNHQGPVDRWKAARAEVHEQVCKHGFDAELGSFTQSYGSKLLDASLLLIPLVGFLPPKDPRVQGTVRAVEQRLLREGLVLRYETDEAGTVDGLPGGEGAFLACSFWLADNYTVSGRRAEAVALFEKLNGLANDVGLLAEEYDPAHQRLVGNFPQAFSHVSLVNGAYNLAGARGPAATRRDT